MAVAYCDRLAARRKQGPPGPPAGAQEGRSPNGQTVLTRYDATMNGAASTSQWGSGAAVFRTDLRLPDRREGKVRDIYTLPPAGNDPARLLIVASDRISAFDVVMPTPIPAKGVLLTRLARFWLEWIQTRGLARTHLVSTDASQIPESAFKDASTTRDSLKGRVTIARRCRVVPIECVVRGYLEGSGLKEYRQTQSVCGIPLPPGLKRADPLPTPIFTPATKEEGGRHDENISFDQACGLVGGPLMERLREMSLAIYDAAAAHARERGIIIADTKFEFGFPLDEGDSAGPMLVDEALTPDSSRFWPVDGYAPGRAQDSFDKQFLRDHLEALVERGIWDKSPPGPTLPEAIVRGTQERYREACARLMDEA